MSASVVSKTQWGGRFWYFAVYFLFALLVMLAWRYAIFAAYKPADLASSSFFDGLHVGLLLVFLCYGKLAKDGFIWPSS